MDRYNKPQFETIDNSNDRVHSLPTSEEATGQITELGNRANITKVIGDSNTEFTKLKGGDWIFIKSPNLLVRVRSVISDNELILDERLPDSIGTVTTAQDFWVIPKNKADLRFISIERGEDEEDADFVTIIDKDNNERDLKDVFSAGVFGNTLGIANKKQPPFIIRFTNTEANTSLVKVTADYNYIQQNG